MSCIVAEVGESPLDACDSVKGKHCKRITNSFSVLRWPLALLLMAQKVIPIIFACEENYLSQKEFINYVSPIQAVRHPARADLCHLGVRVCSLQHHSSYPSS